MELTSSQAVPRGAHRVHGTTGLLLGSRFAGCNPCLRRKAPVAGSPTWERAGSRHTARCGAVGGVGPVEGTQVWTHADRAGEFCHPEPGSRASWQGVVGGRFSCSSRLRVTGGNISKLHRVVSGR